MHTSLALLKEIHGCFSSEEAGAWAAAAVPMILHALPQLGAASAIAQDGFMEAMDLLRDILDSYDENDPDSTAFEICDRLADVLDLLPAEHTKAPLSPP